MPNVPDTEVRATCVDCKVRFELHPFDDTTLICPECGGLFMTPPSVYLALGWDAEDDLSREISAREEISDVPRW